jgi:hypothetical protein
MYGTDIHLMVTIFQQVFRFKSKVEMDPAKYVQQHEVRIKRAGQLFEYLGLAKRDSKSPLGWRPTNSLMGLIAKRLLEEPPKRKLDKISVTFLWDEVFGEDVEENDLGFKALNALLGKNFRANWGTTPQMEEFSCWGYRGPRPGSYRNLAEKTSTRPLRHCSQKWFQSLLRASWGLLKRRGRRVAR